MKNLFSLTLIGIIFIFFKFVTATLDSDASSQNDLSEPGTDDSLSKPEALAAPGPNPDSKSKSNKKALAKAASSDCVSIFDGYTPNKNTLECLRKGFNRSRCGSDDDIPCLCDSLFVHQVVTNCTERFPDFDLLFSSYYKGLCKSLVVQVSCTSTPNPSFPTVTCDDPFKESGFNDSLKDCLKKELKNSLCGSPKNASCLCDSVSAGGYMMECAKDPKTKEALKNFTSNFCQDSLKVSGCVKATGLLELEVAGDGIALKVMGLKKLILLIIGIIIPITLGLIDN